MKTRWLGILYAYPFQESPIWQTFLTLRHCHAVVINPASGYIRGKLGSTDLNNWHWAVDECHKKGIVTIGYLSTDWAKRPMQQLLTEISSYRVDFGITGFFLDETATSMVSLPYYAELRRVIPGMLVLNPGTQVDHRYFSVADVIVTRETDHPDIVPTPDELKEPNKCCHILQGFDPVRTLRQFQTFPDLGFRWFTDVDKSYDSLHDIIPFLDSVLL